ncbi:MAG: PKD domain-containing protein [Bacteroidia bacterium]
MIQIETFKKKTQLSFYPSLNYGLLTLILLGLSGLVQAQPAFYNNSNATTSNLYPLSDGTQNKVQWIYGPSVFKTGGATGTVAAAGVISKIYFRLGSTVNSSANYSNFTVSLAQNQGTSTTWSSTTFATGLTTVFSQSSFTMTGATANSWYGITLTTPFTYDPSKSLVFELKVSAGTGNYVIQTTTGGNQRNYGTYTGTTGTSLATGLVDFGMDFKPSKNDLSTLGITNGMTNTCGATADPIYVQFKNTGVVDIASGQNIPVRTVVTGAASATFNQVYNKAIKVGVTDTIYMGSLNTINITGVINLKSSISYIPADSVRTNDTNVTSKTFLGPSRPKPDYSVTLFCDSVRFTNTSTDVCSRITAYKWDFDNGKFSTLKSPTYSFNSPGTYNVKLFIFYGTGSKDSVTKQVIVNAKPGANFAFTNQCLGVAIDFNNFSFGASSYKWSFGDASTSTVTNPSRTYTAAGTYAVKLVATTANNCKDSITKNVIVYVKPVASFSVSNACAEFNVSFSNSSTTGASYNWDLGDGTASNFFNPSKIYATAGTYGIILTVTNAQGCTDKTSRSVIINSLPVANFTVQNNCKGVPTSFTNTSTNANTYSWTFDDSRSSSSPSPVNTYNAAGNYNVKLTATSINGCNNSITKPVTIYVLPKANFSVKDVCLGVQTSFTNLSTLPSGGGDYLWRFGDGNTTVQVNPLHKYAAAGSYGIRLIAISSFGCKDSALSQVNVFDNPIAAFTSIDACDGLPISFINQSTGTVSQTWDFGDGNNDNSFSPSHQYSGPDVYKVILKVTSSDNCTGEIVGSANVKSKPDIVFVAGNHCHGAEANFSNLSVGASSYTWKFGDGDSSMTTQASHTYTNPGNYNLILKGVSAKGCVVEQSKSITVYPKPIPAFAANTVCYGASTQFINSTTGATSYFWNFGDGSGSSAANNPTYQYFNAGNYKVIFTATSANNCKQELAQTITVAALPIPIFIVQDVCSGVEVKPANSSVGSITSQKWNFGDGYTDLTQSPSHIYTSPGIYKIQLKVTSGIGCTDSTSKTILIYTKPIIKISSDMKISKGYSAQLTASGGTDYLWSPSASLNNAVIPNPIASPSQDTRYSVRVMNAFSCFDSAFVNVTLLEDFTLEPQNLITPNTNGQNDVWKIKGIEFYPTAKVMVFDQWGRIILNQDNYQNLWDGTLDGKPLPDGTYYYVISLPDSERQYKGTINILKN